MPLDIIIYLYNICTISFESSFFFFLELKKMVILSIEIMNLFVIWQYIMIFHEIRFAPSLHEQTASSCEKQRLRLHDSHTSNRTYAVLHSTHHYSLSHSECMQIILPIAWWKHTNIALIVNLLVHTRQAIVQCIQTHIFKYVSPVRFSRMSFSIHVVSYRLVAFR